MADEYITKKTAREILQKVATDNFALTEAYYYVVNALISADDEIVNAPAADVVDGALYRDCRNELCLRCGQYKERHLGACDGCRWKEI